MSFKQFFDLVDDTVKRKHHHTVARLDDGVTRNKITFTIPYETCDSHVARQFQILYRASGDF